jgi:HD-like signal output (HDOD) protein
MFTETQTAPELKMPLDPALIESRVRGCPRLPSLRSIDSALRELLNADQRYTHQISEVIRRDPSLTARILRLVNSVYYGLTTPVDSIEEAVLYLGVRQIRQLAMVTPVIEDFQKLAGNTPFRWREFWQHCIGVAIMTREVISAVHVPQDETDYVAGLVHDVGKIVMAAAFPKHFQEIHRRMAESPRGLRGLEVEVLGLDHSALGGLYLENHMLPEVMVETARRHHQPERAGSHGQIVAAVHLADLVVRHAGIGDSGDATQVTEEDWLQAPAWGILFPRNNQEEKAIARANLKRSLDRLALQSRAEARVPPPPDSRR